MERQVSFAAASCSVENAALPDAGAYIVDAAAKTCQKHICPVLDFALGAASLMTTLELCFALVGLHWLTLKTPCVQFTAWLQHAGFAYKGDAFGADEAQRTLDVNYYGTKSVCEALVPLLTQQGRIVNVSSRSGLLSNVRDKTLQQKFMEAKSTDDIDQLAQQYVDAIRAGRCV